MLYSKILHWELGSYFNQPAYFTSVKDSIFRTGQAISLLHLWSKKMTQAQQFSDGLLRTSAKACESI